MSRWLRLQRWLVGLTVMTLLGLFLLPLTGWLLRVQLRMQVNALPEAYLMDWLGHRAWRMPEIVQTKMRATLQKAVERYPNDYQIQLAAAELLVEKHEERPDRLRALIARFPNEPSLYATVLRYDCLQRIRFNREEGFLLYGNPVPKALPKPKPQDLAAFERIAVIGERLDRDNAYFSAMRAVGLFAARQDREAITALQRAGQKPRWNDYALDEAKGTIRLYEAAFGRSSGSVRISLYSIVLAPHYSLLRAMARVATYKAVEAERTGRAKEGIAIRRALARWGRLVRTQSSSAIGSLVGIDITATAASRPGGAPPINLKLPQRQERYVRYLRQIGQQDEADWMQAEFKAGERAREIIRAGQDRSIFGEEHLSKTALLWIVSLTLLSSALLMSLLWATAALLTRSRFGQGVLPLLLMTGLWTGCMVHFWNTGVVKTTIAMQQVLEDLMFSDNSTTSLLLNLPPVFWQLLCVGFIAYIPLLTAILAVIGGMALGLRASAALAQSIRQVALPVACALFLFYALALAGTAKHESQIEAALKQCLQSEGRYYASLVGKMWPD